MCSVRYGRNYRGVETFCYGWPQRSRTLKPVLYTDLVVSRLQNRRKKKPVSGGLGELGWGGGARRGDARRSGGDTDGRTRPDSRRPARCGCLSLGMDVASSQAPSPSPARFLRRRVPTSPLPSLRPRVPVSSPAILPPSRPEHRGEREHGETWVTLRRFTMARQQRLLENIAARRIQDRAVPLGPAL